MQLSHSESVSMLPKLCPCCCAGAVKIAASLLRQSFLASLLAGRASASAQPQSQTGQKPNRPPTLVQCSELLTTFGSTTTRDRLGIGHLLFVARQPFSSGHQQVVSPEEVVQAIGCRLEGHHTFCECPAKVVLGKLLLLQELMTRP